MIFCCLQIFFFQTKYVSHSLDPDQAQHFDGPDLGPNCLKRLSADGAKTFEKTFFI